MTERMASSIPGTFALGIAIYAAIAGASPCFAEPSHKTVRRSSPAKVGKTAPDTTSTIVKPKVADPAPSDEEIPPPFTLPVASRERTRECGARWQEMKMAGTNGDDDWRDFALKCLTADRTGRR